MKKWETLHELTVNSSQLTVDEIIALLLKNRGLETEEEINDFLHPKLESVTTQYVGIDTEQLSRAVKRIKKAIKNNEQIIVFGDYDVDGITGSAILWETLDLLGAKAIPYIPHRIDEGYGLSIKGIENVIEQYPKTKLIITVDNGIVAHAAVDSANEKGIDVIITDHHVPSTTHPNAHAIVHTTMLCGGGVAWMLSKELLRVIPNSPALSEAEGFRDPKQGSEKMLKQVQHDMIENHLELVALATIADLVPLKAANRILTTVGLAQLQKTKRLGLQALYKEAALDPTTIDVYSVGHLIAPRLNAMGRLEYAMDSLRLLCTRDKQRADDLAFTLGKTNKQRQVLTQDTVMHAKTTVNNLQLTVNKKLIFIADKSYQPGVIGLVAGRLVEEFYRPAIVLSIGETYSKASARSIAGFNIIEFIRSASDLLVDAGGHPMAAGFTVETEKLILLEKTLQERIETALSEDLFTRVLRIDCELPLGEINKKLYDAIQQLAPFGMGNQEPVFVSRKVIIENMRLVGKEGKHLKLTVHSQNNDAVFDAIAFGFGDKIKELKEGNAIDIAYVIDENTWNGNTKLQLKIRDIKKEN